MYYEEEPVTKASPFFIGESKELEFWSLAGGAHPVALSREGEEPRLKTEYETLRQAVLTLLKRHYTKARKRQFIHNGYRHKKLS
ncbi:hypothetical protein D3C75_744960 [compost metagenome]